MGDSADLNGFIGYNLPIFQHIDPKTYSLMIDGAKLIETKHRDQLFNADDSASHFAIVLTGGFKLVRPTVDGDSIIMQFASPGDIIGILLMNNRDSRYPVTSISMGRSSVYKIPCETYRNNWLGNTIIQTKLNSVLATWVSRMQADKGMVKSSLPEKIADLLLRFTTVHSATLIEVPIPLTRQEIADSVGASVESVIRVMSEWNQSGVIKSQKNKLFIMRPEHLRSIVSK